MSYAYYYGSALLLLASLPVLVGCAHSVSSAAETEKMPASWKQRLAEELPAFGHRNWIVVADAAYPKQSAPGIETVVTGISQLEVLEEVVARIEKAPHVRGVVMVDSELDQLREDDAPGVKEYRETLAKLIGEQHVKSMPHEEIIAELDESSRLFNVLILKTDMTLPYSSVFIQLDCGYWDAEREARLRNSE